MAKVKAVYVLNKYLEQDSVLQNLFSPNIVNIFPGVAGEPLPPSVSYPYIRYLDVPLIDRQTPKIRRDFIQLWVGAKDLTVLGEILERLIYLLNYDDNSIARPIVDSDGKYIIWDVITFGGTRPEVPNQDGGVWEQSITSTVSYVIKTYSWEDSKKVVHHVDALLDI